MSILAAHTIGFIGAGNMAEAMIRGLVRGKHIAADRVAASGPRKERLEELRAAYGIDVTTHNREVVQRCGLVVLSIKPQIIDKVLREIGDQLKPGTLLVSIAAGIDTETIEEAVSDGVRVVRAMPNTPALVGAGATAIAAGKHASETDLATARALFDAVHADLARMGARVEYFGERPDLAAVYKLIGNAFVVGINALVADVFAIGAGADVSSADALKILDFFNPSGIISARGKKMVEEDYAPSWELAMARKDVRLMIETADGIPLAALDGIAKRMDALIAEGRGSDDLAVIAKDSTRTQATVRR